MALNKKELLQEIDEAIANLEKRNMKNLFMTVLDNAYTEASMFTLISEDFVTIGRAAVSFAFFNIFGADAENYLNMLSQCAEHTNFCVRLKSGQNTRCVKIVKKLSAELQIELSVKAGNPFQNILALFINIKLIIKAVSYHQIPPSKT